MSVAIAEKYNLDEMKLDSVQQAELDRLLKICHSNMEHCDDELVTKAFKLCFASHYGITRASGEPYYRHPLEVAEIIITEVGGDDTSTIAALLHDTVEDTDVTLEFIQKTFGKTVAKLIDGVTKISGVFKNKGTRQAESFMKLLLSMAEDLRVVLIKFADRLHNMRTIGSLPKTKQMAIAKETMDLYAPLAHRFGLFSIKSELEDLSFKVLDEEAFKYVARKLREKKENRESFVNEFMEPIRLQLDQVGFNFEIKGRPKHIYSIYRKMQRQERPFEEIYDLFAVRIILDEPHTKEDCWRVYSFITDNYVPIPERFRDFISVPKANGYQSLHTTVINRRGRKVEIQIRTRKMDEIAEKGLAAHWKYKEGTAAGNSIDRFVSWVRDILENPRPDAATDFVKDFQLNLYSDEIYIFTPKGELKTLPSGATPIDFAFDIHSEIGERALAAKVNGKIVPLRHKLTSGDQVEVITGKAFNLNPDWINDVVTHRAKARIRAFIKQKRREISDKGREQWEKRSERIKFEFDEQDINKVAGKLRFATTQDMFYEIGSGTYSVELLFKGLKNYVQKGRIEDEKAISPVISEEDLLDQLHKESRQHGDFRGLIINGDVTGVKYSYSKCCSPMPGDDVIGFVSRTGDVKIHRVACKNMAHLLEKESDRVVDVSWSAVRAQDFVGAVKIIGEDRVGMINDITQVLSKMMGTNIKSINVNSDSGLFEGTLFIYVQDLGHLNQVIKRLERVEGITSAYRFE